MYLCVLNDCIFVRMNAFFYVFIYLMCICIVFISFLCFFSCSHFTKCANASRTCLCCLFLRFSRCFTMRYLCFVFLVLFFLLFICLFCTCLFCVFCCCFFACLTAVLRLLFFICVVLCDFFECFFTMIFHLIVLHTTDY